MSQTFELVCLECKERVWVGQSAYLYTTHPEISETSAFLHKHYGHTLKFVDSETACDLTLSNEPWRNV